MAAAAAQGTAAAAAYAADVGGDAAAVSWGAVRP